MNNDATRVFYYLEHINNCSVATFTAQIWHDMIIDDGAPTILECAPYPLSKVHHDANVIAVVASGNLNPSHGIDILRCHEKDYPYIYNLDHYTIIEDFHLHPEYLNILYKGGVDDSEALRTILNSWIFIVGPVNNKNSHWFTEIPEYIKNAKKKYGDIR
jgi:hypothetical protein